MKKILVLGTGLFFCFVMNASDAEEGPLGPVGPSTPSISDNTNEESDKKTAPADLPYKPPESQQKKISRTADDSFHSEKESAGEIPYIGSQSPEPVGAPDPPF